MSQVVSVLVCTVCALSHASLSRWVSKVAKRTKLKTSVIWLIGIVATRACSDALEGKRISISGLGAHRNTGRRICQRIRKEDSAAVLQTFSLSVVSEIPVCAGCHT